MIGDVYRIKHMNKRGEAKIVTGLMVGNDDRNRQLFVLLLYAFDDSVGLARQLTVHSKTRECRMGYTTICTGNCIVEHGNAIVKHLGYVTDDDLYKVNKDIFESNRCGVLESFIEHADNQSGFFNTFNQPKGMTVVGGMGGRL